ncbi:MAG TPA: hypothetical protein VGE07_09380 [Herpetosiphonaceae bacterium]
MNLRRRFILRRAGAGAAVKRGPDYLYRDLFSTKQKPAETSPAEPGPGQRTIMGGYGLVFEDSLRGMAQQSSPEWGRSAVLGESHKRAAGTITQIYVIPSDAGADGFIGLVDPTGGADPRLNGHGLIWENGALSVATPGQAVPIYAGLRNLRPIEYLVTVIEYDQGAAVLLSAPEEDQGHGMEGPLTIPAWPQARLLHSTRIGAAPMLAPAASFLGDVGGYIHGHLVDDMRVIADIADYARQDPLAAVADRFGGPDHPTSIGPAYSAEAGTFGMAGGEVFVDGEPGLLRIYRPSDLYDANGIYEWDVVIPEGGAPLNAGGYFCRADGDNYWRWLADDGSFRIQTWVDGSFDRTIYSTHYDWAPGLHQVRIQRQGASVRSAINDTPLSVGNWFADPNNRHPRGTGIGLYSINATAMRWRYLAATPPVFMLAEAGQRGVAPRLAAAVATIGRDNFEQPGRLSERSAEAGGRWTEPFGEWSAKAGRVACGRSPADGNGTNAALQELGTPYGQFEVTVHTAPVFSTGLVRAGIVLNWRSNQEYMAIRLFADPLGQPLSDEVELLEIVGGNGLIQRKVNIGNALLADGAYRLRVQHFVKASDGRQRPIVQVLLWDGAAWRPRLTHTPSMAFSAPSHGLYLDQSDDGSTFSGWHAQAVIA